MQGLDGRVGVVTGSAKGIGKATATRLAAEGVNVVVADLNREAAKKLHRKFEHLAVKSRLSKPT